MNAKCGFFHLECLSQIWILSVFRTQTSQILVILLVKGAQKGYLSLSDVEYSLAKSNDDWFCLPLFIVLS